MDRQPNRFCPKCGAELAPGFAFCPQCGFKADGADAQNGNYTHDRSTSGFTGTGGPIPTYAPPDMQQGQPKPKKKRGCLIAALICIPIALLLFLIIVIPVMTGYQNRAEEVQNQQAEENVSFEEYETRCKELDYESVARDPGKFQGQYAKVTGTVIQVSEEDEGTSYRVYTDDGVWLVGYLRKDGDLRILEDDEVTVYGICIGVVSYESIMRQTITVPAIRAQFIVQNE